MSSEQLFLYVTRGLCLFCVLSALIPILYLPPDILDAVHYWHLSRSSEETIRSISSETYLFRVYLFRSAALVLQTAILFLAAGWFYRGGAHLRRFFGLAPARSEDLSS
jgi:hypothetical protein